MTTVLNISRPGDAPRFKLVHIADLKLKPTQWLIRDLLERDTLAMIFGEPKSGKSFIAVDIACCIASGLDFHGRRVRAPGHVVILAGEGQAGLTKRLHAWCDWRKVNAADIPVNVSDGPASIIDHEALRDVVAAVDQAAKKDGPPALVVVDTLARNFGPGDESSTRDMNQFIQGLDEIRTTYNCGMLVIHHPGHGNKDRARGAMALPGALDALYRVDRDALGTVRFEPQFMKDAAIPDALAFTMRVVELPILDEDGRPETTCVLEATDFVPKAAPENTGKHQRTMIRVLHDLYDQARAEKVKTGQDPDTARIFVATWRKACIDAGVPNNRFYEAKKAMDEKQLARFANECVYPL